MATLGTNLLGMERCPHCGIADPNLIYRANVPYPIISSNERNTWIIYQCATCNDIVAGLGTLNPERLNQYSGTTLDNNPQVAKRIIPTSREVDADLPPRAKRYLGQAINSVAAPDGAIMLSGSAIDSMLKEVGYQDGPIYSRINKAVEDNIITKAMGEWAHSVRIEANKPRHADLEDPHATREMAEQSIEFAEALGEYLFALPARIERGKKASREAEVAAGTA